MRSHFRNIPTANLPAQRNPFKGWTEEQIDAHIAKDRYGDFFLTDAVRPSPTLIPEEGYRFDVYHDKETGLKVPVLMVAASREKLFDLFMSFVDTVEGDTVDVVLESSHEQDSGHENFACDDIDKISLQSNLWDFQGILTDDGCTGIAVLNPSIPVEVQFDDHKLLIAYGVADTLRSFEDVMMDAGIHRKNSIRFITEDAHLHSSRVEFIKRFKELQMLLSGDCTF